MGFCGLWQFCLINTCIINIHDLPKGDAHAWACVDCGSFASLILVLLIYIYDRETSMRELLSLINIALLIFVLLLCLTYVGATRSNESSSNTHASVTKQYNLVPPVSGRYCVPLGRHSRVWLFVTDFAVYRPLWSSACRNWMSTNVCGPMCTFLSLL